MKRSTLKVLSIAAIIAVIAGVYLALTESALMDLISNRELLVSSVRKSGSLGPLLIIGLMALAIVFNPLPSAPVALAAGAVYGHYLGTVYIVVGAEVGAVAAFMIARFACYEFVQKLLGETRPLGRFSSQNALTGIVFVSRLIPFMSFDLVSYAAGLSPLRLWRFALATLLGLMPVSFALAHLGDEIVRSENKYFPLLVLGIGLLTLVPLLFVVLRGSDHGDDAQ